MPVQYKLDLHLKNLNIKADWINGMLSVETNDSRSYTCLQNGTWFSTRNMELLSGKTVIDRNSGLTLHMVGQMAVDQRYKEEVLKTLEDMA